MRHSCPLPDALVYYEEQRVHSSRLTQLTGIVFNIQRFSVNDGPGIRTTVFLKGCPLHCPWCHNPESISPKKEIALRADRCIRCGDCLAACRNHAVVHTNGTYVTLRERCLDCGECVDVCVAEGRTIVGNEMTAAEVLSEIRKDVVFFDQSGGGATFSGGEPFLQHEFLLSLLLACRQQGIHTTVDTTGYTSPSILERVARHTDLFLYDLKTLDDERHQEYTGISNRRILGNLRLLATWNRRVIVRVPIIPGVNDDDDHLHAIGAFVGSLDTIEEIHVLPYHPAGIDKYQRLGREYAMASTTSPQKEKLLAMAALLRHHVPLVAVGG